MTAASFAEKIPLATLVCPDCRTALQASADALTCTQCGSRYGSENGALKLWPPSRTAALTATVENFRAPRSAARRSRFLRALLPPNPNCDPQLSSRQVRVRELLNHGVVLNLGAKDSRWGSHVVNLDLVLPQEDHAASQPGIDLLADIEHLPFADGSVDGVICTFVLEHVADARACLAEITRVLKPGGAVYVTVPFLFPTHPDPLDRWRWTLDGLRYELRACEEISAGPCGGPFSAFVSVMPALVGSIFSSFLLFNAVRCVLGWLLWPLKFLDYFAIHSAKAYTAAANFYFLGRKRAH